MKKKTGRRSKKEATENTRDSTGRRSSRSSAGDGVSLREKLSESLQEHTKHGILALIMLVLAIFLIAASLSLAGVAGSFTFHYLGLLFGSGYYLLPLASLVLAWIFATSGRPHLVTTSLVGSALFLVSGLALTDIAFRLPSSGAITGGKVGELVSLPFLKLFDPALGGIILGAIVVAAVLVTFDTHLTLEPKLFGRRLWGSDPAEDDVESEDELSLDEDAEKAQELATITASAPGLNKNVEADTGPTTGPTEKTGLVAKMFGKGKEEALEEEAGLVTDFGRHFVRFTPPPLSLLERDSGKPGVGDIKANANIIKRTLQNFGIEVEMDEISIGPSITRYALKPAEGVKLSRIVGLQNDLSLSLAAHPLRIEAPIPGKSLVGIEIPNTTKTVVRLGSLLGEKGFGESVHPLMLALGRSISGHSHFTNLAKAPHLLIAGATGSGKSVVIHTLITSLLYRNPPEALRFLMIDPKRVELTLYNKIPHLLTPVITDAKKTILTLRWAAKEMDRRYDILEKHAARDIQSYHTNIYEPARKGVETENEADLVDELPPAMPYIVIVIDELADIMSMYPRELEAAIVRLAQMSRAVGIHLILSTQRPSTEVITGLIKANIPSRIALQVPSQIDSRTIIDMPGAEKLLGSGDMLYLGGDTSKPIRIQGSFLSETEVKEVANYLKKHYEDVLPAELNLQEVQAGESFASGSINGNAFGDETGGNDDELYESARDAVVQAGKASSSYLQRKLKIGYARAARLLDLLEERGVVGPGEGAKPREVHGGTGPQEGFGEDATLSELDYPESATINTTLEDDKTTP